MSMNEDDFNNPVSPYGHPLRMVDRVESLDVATAKLVARKAVSRNEPLLQGHFPSFLILPGILQLEALAQASALLLKTVEGKDMMLRTIISESRLKHTLPVLPGDTMMLETQLITRKDPFYTFRVRATLNGEDAAKGQIVIRWLDGFQQPLNGAHG
jgi:3-hydroxymyristoyl/3-hydroxydecanoyl-(acyl carrier protein) dehydratase